MERRSSSLASLLIGAFLLSSTALAAGFKEEFVSFVTHDGLEIQCILSFPDHQPGPFPGMLLIPGSGLHDADVTLEVSTLRITDGTQSLFKPIARFFSRQGWAVQRCNKRGASFGHADDRSEVLNSSTLADLVEDARTALGTLHGHPRVVASPLVVLGHSEGTLVATQLALESPEIDLLVLLGSVARSFGDLLEYQLVDRNLTFFREAADANGDGRLTLEELDRLDGEFGLGSVYVLNSAEVLFESTRDTSGQMKVSGFHRQTDRDRNGQLDISREIEPALRRETSRLLDLGQDGSLGRYWQSLIEAEAPATYIHQVKVPLLFVHGGLDVQTPIDEPLSMMQQLESRDRRDYDILIFPSLGHSLSRPNDFFLGDGGLSILDNLTLNTPKPNTRRRLLERIEANLAR